MNQKLNAHMSELMLSNFCARESLEGFLAEASKPYRPYKGYRRVVNLQTKQERKISTYNSPIGTRYM